MKRSTVIKFDTDIFSETLISCGYDFDIGGAGSDFPMYVLDENNGSILWSTDVLGERVGGPVILDIDGDGTDEIIWSTEGCVMTIGCITITTYLIYAPQLSEEFWMKDTAGEIVYSGNLSAGKYAVFKEFLSEESGGRIPDPIQESQR